MRTRKKVTLMPAISLAGLALMMAMTTLSSTRLYAATPQHYSVVTVHPGDTLWSIASAHTGDNDVQDTIDRITSVNHLQSPTLQAGQRLRIPN